MTTSRLDSDSLVWTTDGVTIACSATATADTLTLVGASAADVTLDGVGTLNTPNINTQNITRISDTSTGNIFVDGTGNVNVGTDIGITGIVSIGPSPATMTLSNTRTFVGASTIINGFLVQKTVIVTTSTAGNITYIHGSLRGGFIKRDCSGASRSDTFPTASQIVGGILNAVIGTSYVTRIQNDSGAGEILTLLTGTGVTFDAGSLVINPGETLSLIMHVDNAFGGSEAVTYYTTSTMVKPNNPSYIMAGSDLQPTMGTGDTLPYNLTLMSNGISLNATTFIFTLLPDRIYTMSANVSCFSFDRMQYKWVDGAGAHLPTTVPVEAYGMNFNTDANGQSINTVLHSTGSGGSLTVKIIIESQSGSPIWNRSKVSVVITELSQS